MTAEVDKADRIATFRARTVATGIHGDGIMLAIRKNHTSTLGLVG